MMRAWLQWHAGAKENKAEMVHMQKGELGIANKHQWEKL